MKKIFFFKTWPRTSAHLYDCFWCEYMATSLTQVVNKYNSYILLQESFQSDGWKNSYGPFSSGTDPNLSPSWGESLQIVLRPTRQTSLRARHCPRPGPSDGNTSVNLCLNPSVSPSKWSGIYSSMPKISLPSLPEAPQSTICKSLDIWSRNNFRKTLQTH